MNQQMEARRKKSKTFQKYIDCSVQGDGETWASKEANQELIKMIEEMIEKQTKYCGLQNQIQSQSQNQFQNTKALPIPKTLEIEGMKILLVGEICQCGMNYLAKYFEDELKQRFSRFFISLGRLEGYERANTALPNEASQIIMETPVVFVGEGGMYRALNELAVVVDSGFVVDYHKVPVSQVAIEFCEFFDMDPWRLFSGNHCFLVVDVDGNVSRELKALGVNVATIGRLQKDKKKVIRYTNSESLLNRAKPDELLELLKK